MLARHLSAVVCVAIVSSVPLYAATEPVAPAPAVVSAANPELPTGPIPAASESGTGTSGSVSADDHGLVAADPKAGRTAGGVKPFSTAAIQVKIGLSGIGADLAVPVAGRMNLRAGGSFFSYNPNLVEDGIGVHGNIQLRSGSASLDIFPFGNAFRISPGLVFYNGDNIAATASVSAGQTFTLNSVQYYSSASSPVTGNFGLNFGNKVAPSFTLGFGNMIPRKGGHWSVPFEIGGEYIGQTPAITLNLTGTACQGSPTTNCTNIATDPTTQKNLAAEIASLNSNIPSQLVFLPIVSIGVSYKFGH